MILADLSLIFKSSKHIIEYISPAWLNCDFRTNQNWGNLILHFWRTIFSHILQKTIVAFILEILFSLFLNILNLWAILKCSKSSTHNWKIKSCIKIQFHHLSFSCIDSIFYWIPPLDILWTQYDNDNLPNHSQHHPTIIKAPILGSKSPSYQLHIITMICTFPRFRYVK